jgi:hypothetical protein
MNPKIMMLHLSVTAFLLSNPLIGAQTDRGGTEDKVQKVFNAPINGKLVADVNIGSVEINTTKTDQIKVEVLRKALVLDPANKRNEVKEKDLLEQNEITFAQEGETVIIRARTRKDSSFSHRGTVSLDVRYVISVPEIFNVDLTTSGGDISVAEMTGAVKTRTSGGGLKFTRIRGQIDGHTSGGGIQVNDCEGPLNIHTSGGGVTIKNANGRVDAKTSGGSILASFSSPFSDDVRLETSGGDVTMQVATDSAFNLEASSNEESVGLRTLSGTSGTRCECYE